MPRKPDEEEEAPESGEEELEEEEEEEEEEPAAAEPDEKPTPRPRPRAKKRERPARKASQWQSGGDADLLWNEVHGVLGQPGEYAHITAYDIDIVVSRDNGTRLGNLSGAEVAGNGGQISPGNHLRETVIRNFHVPLNQPGGRYDFMFLNRKNGSKMIARGRLELPSIETIIHLRRAQIEATGQAPPVMPTAPAATSAPVPAAAAPLLPGFGYPQPQPSVNPEVSQLRSEFAELRGVLGELMQAVRTPAAQPAPPPAPPTIVERMRELVEMRNLLRELEPPAPPPPVQQPPVVVQAAQPHAVGTGAPPTRTDLITAAQAEVSAIDRIADVLTGSRRALARIDRVLGGAPAQVVEQEEEESGELPPPGRTPKPPRWQVEAVPGAQFFGRHGFNLARDPDGSISPMGTLMSNPIIFEKALEGIGPAIGPAIATVIEKAGSLIPQKEVPPPEPAPVPAAAAPSAPAETPASNGVAAPARTAWPQT